MSDAALHPQAAEQRRFPAPEKDSSQHQHQQHHETAIPPSDLSQLDREVLAAYQDAYQRECDSTSAVPSVTVLSAISFSKPIKKDREETIAEDDHITEGEAETRQEKEKGKEAHPSQKKGEEEQHADSHVNIFNVTLGPRGAQCVAAAIQHVPRLSTLSVTQAYIGDDGCAALMSTIVGAAQSVLVTTHQQQQQQRGEEVVGVSPAVNVLTPACLRRLCLCGDGLNNASVHVAAALPHLPFLEELDLSWNRLGLDAPRNGIQSLCVAIKTHRSLQLVDLSNNMLGSSCCDFGSGAAAGFLSAAGSASASPSSSSLAPSIAGISLADVISSNSPSLTKLNLAWNNLGGEAAYLAEALANNQFLCVLSLEGNNCAHEDLQAARRRLDGNAQRGLQLRAQKMVSDAASDELRALKRGHKEALAALRAARNRADTSENENQQLKATVAELQAQLGAKAVEFLETTKELKAEASRAQAGATQAAKDAHEFVSNATTRAEQNNKALSEAFEEREKLVGKLRQMESNLSDAVKDAKIAQDSIEVKAAALKAATDEAERANGELSTRRRDQITLEARLQALTEENARKDSDIKSKLAQLQALEERVQTTAIEREKELARLRLLEEEKASYDATTANKIGLVTDAHQRELADVHAMLAQKQRQVDDSQQLQESTSRELQRLMDQRTQRHGEEAQRWAEQRKEDAQRVAQLQLEKQALSNELISAEAEQKRAECQVQLNEGRIQRLSDDQAQMSGEHSERLEQATKSAQSQILALEDALSRRAEENGALHSQLSMLERQLTKQRQVSEERVQQVERELTQQVRLAVSKSFE